MHVPRHHPNSFFSLAAAGVLSLSGLWARGQVPPLLTYQGRVTTNGVAFSGAAQFKFALVDPAGAQFYWRNAADTNNDGEPDAAVAIPVSGGLFTVQLGDTNLPGMVALPISVFTNNALSVRIWFDDGVHKVQLSPDQPLASAGYAMMAADVADGAITPAKLAGNTAGSITADLSAQVAGLSSQTANLNSQTASLAAQMSGLASQLANLSSQVGAGQAAGLTAASTDPQDTMLTSLGYQLFYTLPAPTQAWVSSAAAGAPAARTLQAGVWSGLELFIWGGKLAGGADSGTGARYRPDLDQWQPIPTTDAPSARSQHSAIWSGQEMIVWGGISAATSAYLNDGGRFAPGNPGNPLWSAVPTNGAPDGRAGHVAAWTGSSMVIWGGRNNNGILGDGAFYSPSSNQWSPLSLPGAPSPRSGAGVVYTANRVIIWGGQNDLQLLNTGAQLLCDRHGVPSAWGAMGTKNAPAARIGHAAVWTGQKMLVWGGQGAGQVNLADGAIYDPVTDTWTPMSTSNAPSARSNPAAVWTGQELLIFGGETAAGTAIDGGAYDPAADKWRALPATGSPVARSGATAVWSGTELLVFAGSSSGAPVAALQRLNPQPPWYLYRKP